MYGLNMRGWREEGLEMNIKRNKGGKRILTAKSKVGIFVYINTVTAPLKLHNGLP